MGGPVWPLLASLLRLDLALLITIDNDQILVMFVIEK